MHKENLTRAHMHGLALPSVLVMLLLCGWLALHAWRSLWLNELLLQAHAHALHTQNWADATLLAALDDVLQRNTNTSSNTAMQRHEAGSDTDHQVFIPSTAAQLDLLRQRLGNNNCRAGLCAPDQPLSWLAEDRQRRWSSGMPVVFDNVTSPPNTTTHYWIEIFLQADAQDQAQLGSQNKTPNGMPAAPVWVYRITAMASGVKSAAPTVLQAIWLQPAVPGVGVQAETGRWISWTVWHDPP